MSATWAVVAARARGMSTHLLDDDTLTRLSRVDAQSALLDLLARSAYGEGIQRTGSSPRTVEVAVARVAERRLGILSRWMHPDERLLAPVFLPLDARAIRDLLRAIAAGRRLDEPLGDGTPTPTLTRRSLLVLAAARSPGSLAATLAAWSHPLAPGLSAWTKSGAGALSLYQTEAELGRAMAEAVVESAGKGDDSLRRHATEAIDTWNTSTALLLAGTPHGADPDGLFLNGGEILEKGTFVTVASVESRAQAATLLARALRRSGFASALGPPAPGPAAFEDRMLDLRIRRRQEEARERPLSSAPVLLLALRLRRESRAVRRAAWRASLSSRRAS